MTQEKRRENSDRAFVLLLLGAAFGLVALYGFGHITLIVCGVSLAFLFALAGILVLVNRTYFVEAVHELQPVSSSQSNTDFPGDNRPRILKSPLLQIFEQLTDVYLVVDGSLDILYANSAANRFFGYRKPGQKLTSLIRHPSVLEGVEQALKNGETRGEEIFLPVPVERHVAYRVAAVQPDLDGYEQAYAVVVLQDMTDIRRAERMRVDFIANASHELKTPLTSVIGFLETLMGPAKHDQEAADHFMPIMAEQALRMKRLVEDLLSLSRIEVSEHLAPEDPVDLCAIINQVDDTVASDAVMRDIRIDIDGCEEDAIVIGNENDLYRLVLNLAENGIKYGREGGTLTIKVKPAELRGAAAYCLSVRDDGIGIAPEDIPRLTERFYRVDVKSSRKVGGTGLGLAIVKHIVNYHRGELHINSELKKGSCFKVYLPSYPSHNA